LFPRPARGFEVLLPERQHNPFVEQGLGVRGIDRQRVLELRQGAIDLIG